MTQNDNDAQIEFFSFFFIIIRITHCEFSSLLSCHGPQYFTFFDLDFDIFSISFHGHFEIFFRNFINVVELNKMCFYCCYINDYLDDISFWFLMIIITMSEMFFCFVFFLMLILSIVMNG